MTQLANITIKNGAATPADVTFVAYQPQSGSDSALWYLSGAGSRATWTRATLSVRKTNGKGNARRHKLGFNIPIFDAQGVQIGAIPFSGELVVPDIAVQADIDNAAAYIANLYASSLIKDTLKTVSPAI
ncbi:MAG: hypothetical protein [Sanya fiers-like virus 14]|nr:MAG: hypothetical protein [Sanya fiers-like virus 14]UUW21268.1 MAG: hypothetical protein [Sanya fiers-like virus 14]